MQAELIDLARWPRRATYELFRGYAQPWFSVCVLIDVSALQAAVAARKREGRPGGLSIACHYMALQALRGGDALRLRLHAQGVQRLATVHAGTTVLRADESFGFATLMHDDSYTRFARAARAAIDAARAGAPPPETDPLAMIHCTTLPWLHFSSFSHARERGPGEDIPKIAFGQALGGRLPISIDVHHALVDGLHVARYVQAFEALAREPARWIDS